MGFLTYTTHNIRVYHLCRWPLTPNGDIQNQRLILSSRNHLGETLTPAYQLGPKAGNMQLSCYGTKTRIHCNALFIVVESLFYRIAALFLLNEADRDSEQSSYNYWVGRSMILFITIRLHFIPGRKIWHLFIVNVFVSVDGKGRRDVHLANQKTIALTWYTHREDAVVKAKYLNQLACPMSIAYLDFPKCKK